MLNRARSGWPPGYRCLTTSTEISTHAPGLGAIKVTAVWDGRRLVRVGQTWICPPSTKYSAPVMNELSGPARKAARAATSSGRPMRRSGRRGQRAVEVLGALAEHAGQAFDRGCGYGTGRDDIDAHASRSQFGGPGPAHTAHSCLESGVDAHSGGALMDGGGGQQGPWHDPEASMLAGLLLAVLRGIEALGKGGSSPDSLRTIAETALALLPRPLPAAAA